MICYATFKNAQIPFEIDDEDNESVSRYKWNISAQGYPVVTVWKIFNGIRIGETKITLHEFLFGKAPKGKVWDHINRIKLDNQRENFRLVNRSFHGFNKSMQRNNTSGIVGIRWDSWRNRWLVPGKGRYKTLEEATEARKNFELEHWGETRLPDTAPPV